MARGTSAVSRVVCVALAASTTGIAHLPQAFTTPVGQETAMTLSALEYGRTQLPGGPAAAALAGGPILPPSPAAPLGDCPPGCRRQRSPTGAAWQRVQ